MQRFNLRMIIYLPNTRRKKGTRLFPIQIVRMDLTTTFQTIRNNLSVWFEPFQNPPSSAPTPTGPSVASSGSVESSKQAIATFFTWWNQIPNEFLKSADIVSTINKWSPYTSAKPPYTLSSFASLDDATYQILKTTFTNAYVFSLIDTYIALQKRHSTRPLTPLPKPQTVPKDSKADRLLASKGDTSIQSFYIKSYYPALYSSIQSQLSGVFKIIEVVLSKSSQEERNAADRLLPKRKEDQVLKKAAPIPHILKLSELYSTYIVRARQYLPGGEKYASVEFEYRNTLQARLDKFLVYFYENALRDTDTPVAKAGIAIPKELAKLPTSLPLKSKSLMELVQIEAQYFGAKGLEKLASSILAEAVLENRRDAVESLLRTFYQTYTDLSKYCEPSGFPKEAQDAYTLLPTYWKEVRQKGFNDLPLGKEADRTAKEIPSLYALEGRFLVAFQKIVGVSITCFTKTAAEKAGNQRGWNPHPTLVSAIADPIKLPAKLDVDALTEVRNSYMQLWIFLDSAAREQTQFQYSTYSELVDFSLVLGITTGKRPFPTDLPLYSLKTEYEELDRVGTEVLENIKRSFSESIQEFSKFYSRVEVFQTNAEVQALVQFKSLQDVFGTNTSQEDLQTLQKYSFYTPKLLKSLQSIQVQYIAEPGGNLARLRGHVQTELMRLVDAFKVQWDSYGVKSYPSYEADRKTLMTPGVPTSQLIGLLDRYTTYVQKTQNLEALQEFASSLRDLRSQYELFGQLYTPNKSWLPATLPPEIQQAAEQYQADAEFVQNSKSMTVLSSLVARYTGATRALWLFFNSYLPQVFFDPYTMLIVEYGIYKDVLQSAQLPVSSIEKDRFLFQSFVEPNQAFADWLSRFRTRVVEDTFPKLQSFLKDHLNLYVSTAANPPTLYTSTPYEIRDSLHDIAVAQAKENVVETKSRVFQIISVFLQKYRQGIADDEHSSVQTVLTQIQSTDDMNYVLVQEGKYRRAILVLEGSEEVQSMLEAMDTKELQEVHGEFQKATKVPALPDQGLLQAFENQLRTYIPTFWDRYAKSTSRTRYALIPNNPETISNIAGKKAVLQLAKKYADLTLRLELAEQQEATLVAIDQFKDRLYNPNLLIVAERPLHLMKAAFDADMARWKSQTVPTEFLDAFKPLEETRNTYVAASKEWLSLLRATLLANLTTFSKLYIAYTEFDKSYSDFYDLEPIPPSFTVKVQEDIAYLEKIPLEYSPSLEMRLNTIRTTYYFFPETSQFPTFVRFVKSQVQSYLQKYVAEYEKIETAIQPAKLPIANLQGRITPALYTSVGNLQDLLDVIEQLEKGTTALRTAVALQGKKESTRRMLDSLEDLMAFFREQVGSQPSKVDVNIPQMRIDLQYAEMKEDIDGKYELLANAFAVMASDALKAFNIAYNKNIGLRSYFYREAVDVLNAFTLYFTKDVESVARNTPDENEQLARNYISYTKTVLDAQPAAAVVQDTTEKYRKDTLLRIQQVGAIAEQLIDIKKIRTTAVDISGATSVVESASYIHEMEPTRNAYEQIFREQSTAVQDYANGAIGSWKNLYDSFAPFTKWLPANQQAIAERVESPTDKSIDVVLNLARKYIRYKAELVRYTVPNGTFFSKVRLDVQNKIDGFLEQQRLVADLSGALPPIDTLQDKKSVQTASLGELQKIYASYTKAEQTLLDHVSSYAIQTLQTLFLQNNKTLLLPEYAVPRERATFLIPLLERRAIPIPSLVIDLKYYGSLISRIDISLQRLNVLRILDEIEKDIDEIELQAAEAHIDIVEQEQLDVERSRIQTMTNPADLDRVQAIYISYKNRIQSQLNAWVQKTLEDYVALYLEVQKDGTLTDFDRTFVGAYTQIEKIRGEIMKGTTIPRRVEIRSFYAGILTKAKQLRATILSRKEIENKTLWREQQTKRLETSAAMQRFLEAYQTYSLSYPPKLRQAIRETTADLDRIQKTTVREELDGLLQKYTRLLQDIGRVIEEEQTKRTESVALLVNRFQSLYLPHISNIQSFPSYLQIDIRMIYRDLDTLKKSPDMAIVEGINTQYTGYMNALTKYLKEKGIVVGAALQSKKEEVRNLIRSFNELFLANTAVFDEFPIEVQRKIRAISGDIQYLENPTMTREEINDMYVGYQNSLRILKDVLEEIDETAENTALIPSLEKVQSLFRSRYETVDSTKIPPNEMPFFQELLRGLENPTTQTNAAEAISAYTAGLRKLAVLPTTSERRIENGPFNALQEVMGYFLNEYKIRDVRAFIPADRLLLTGLRKDAPAYINLYKTPPPNMRNYEEIVGQVVKQYWDGLRILRTYPLIS
jgi:hypothetical protein